jgi:hypothetical protein
MSFASGRSGALIFIVLVAILAAGCNRQPSAAAQSAAATATAAAPTPYVVSQIADPTEAQGWANFVLTYDYCTGVPDAQRYASTPMQQTLEAIIAENGGRGQVGLTSWEVYRLSDQQIMAALPFQSGNETRRIEFLIRQTKNEVAPRNSYADEAIQRVRAGCQKNGG